MGRRRRVEEVTQDYECFYGLYYEGDCPIHGMTCPFGAPRPWAEQMAAFKAQEEAFVHGHLPYG